MALFTTFQADVGLIDVLQTGACEHDGTCGRRKNLPHHPPSFVWVASDKYHHKASFIGLDSSFVLRSSQLFIVVFLRTVCK